MIRCTFLKAIATAAIGPGSVDTDILKVENTPKKVKRVQYLDLHPSTVFLGCQAGTNVTTGLHNVAIGKHALRSISTGIENPIGSTQAPYSY